IFNPQELRVSELLVPGCALAFGLTRFFLLCDQVYRVKKSRRRHFEIVFPVEAMALSFLYDDERIVEQVLGKENLRSINISIVGFNVNESTGVAIDSNLDVFYNFWVAGLQLFEPCVADI